MEAVVCIAFTLAQMSFAGVFSTVTAFPFEQIALGLRALSLSGKSGNTIAILIYAAVSLSPAAVLLILRKRRKLLPEDVLLGLLSIMLFVVLYLMINPGIISILSGGLPIAKMMLGGAVYSIIFGYFILRTLRLFFHSDAKRLEKYMSVMLGLLGALFIYLVCGILFSGLLTSFTTLRASNIDNGQNLITSYVFLSLQFAVNALPYVLDIWIISSAMQLFDELRADRYSEKTVTAATRMSRYCTVALAAMVLTNIGFNLLQLLFAKMLVTLNVSVSIPVFSIAFVLVALLLTRFIAENKQLKDENDAFI